MYWLVNQYMDVVQEFAILEQWGGGSFVLEVSVFLPTSIPIL